LNHKSKRGRPTRGFLEKTLDGMTRAVEQSVFTEEIARQPGWLQFLDPRAKLIGALALLLAASLSRQLSVLAGLHLAVLTAAVTTRIPMRLYMTHVWIAMPFFTGFLALPALFSPLTPGPPLLTLLDLSSPHLYLAITRPGVVTAAFLVLRVAASVSIVLLLALTTRWSGLLAAVRVLRVPRTLVLILGMTYRYIGMFLRTAGDMFLSRQSRMVGRVPAAEDRRWLAASIGTLLVRSYTLGDEIYLAMQSRGFRGEHQVLEARAWRGTDWLWMGVFVGSAAVAAWLGR
jgi:cobalt/nickel transport system permease protein